MVCVHVYMRPCAYIALDVWRPEVEHSVLGARAQCSRARGAPGPPSSARLLPRFLGTVRSRTRVPRSRIITNQTTPHMRYRGGGTPHSGGVGTSTSKVSATAPGLCVLQCVTPRGHSPPASFSAAGRWHAWTGRPASREQQSHGWCAWQARHRRPRGFSRQQMNKSSQGREGAESTLSHRQPAPACGHAPSVHAAHTQRIISEAVHDR